MNCSDLLALLPDSRLCYYIAKETVTLNISGTQRFSHQIFLLVIQEYSEVQDRKVHVVWRKNDRKEKYTCRISVVTTIQHNLEICLIMMMMIMIKLESQH